MPRRTIKDVSRFGTTFAASGSAAPVSPEASRLLRYLQGVRCRRPASTTASLPRSNPLLSLTLAATRGNQVKAAQLLGLNRNTLRKKIRDLDVQVVRGLR